MYQSPNQPQYPSQPGERPPAPPRSPKKLPSLWIIASIAGALVLLAVAIGYAFNPSKPLLSPAQFKAQAQDTTVENLDKDGNAGKGSDVHFTCKILKFVKDGSGNTAGANVESADTSSYSFTVIHVEFPSGTNVAELNEGDTLEVWGTDEGVFSGQNALGGTVQEVAVNALYLTDDTTGYGIE